jgi:hypothetical protein
LPNEAFRCDLDGNPLEVLSKAYRMGEVMLSIRDRPIEPKVTTKPAG